MAAKSKPFIAARVPEGLNEALEKHVEATGESRTTALINALSSYLKWSDSKEHKASSAVDRLSLLEKRVTALEEITKQDKDTQESQMEFAIKFDSKQTNVTDNADKSDNKNPKDSGSNWLTIREAHERYCSDRTYEGFRRLKPEQLQEIYGLEFDLNRKKGKKPCRWVRKANS